MEKAAILLELGKIGAGLLAAAGAAWVATRNSDRAVSVSEKQAETQRRQMDIAAAQAETQRRQAVIAAGQSKISQLQTRNAHVKLRLDLFEKRFVVYRLMHDILLALIAKDWNVGGKSNRDVIDILLQTPFLFGDDLKTLQDKLVKAVEYHAKNKDDPAKSEEISKWATETLEVLNEKFRPYLTFRDVIELPPDAELTT